MLKRFKLITATALVTSAIVLASVILVNQHMNKQQEPEISEEKLDQSVINQQVFEERIRLTTLDIETINKRIREVSDLVLIEETGNATIDYSKFADKWNSWLTTSQIVIMADYKVLVAIPTESFVVSIKDEQTVLVEYAEKDIYINAVQLSNKAMYTERDLFAMGFSDDEKIVLEEQIVEGVKNQVNISAHYSHYENIITKYFEAIVNPLGFDVEVKPY